MRLSSRTVLGAVVATSALSITATMGLADAAGLAAGPVVGPSGDAFYNAPASLPDANGSLVQYRTASVGLGSAAPAVKAWTLLYKSSKVDGSAVPVTGTVIEPAAKWTGSGSRPVIAYAVGTQGLANSCAPSKQLAASSEYETANIVAALNKGYAVSITDNDGYTNGGKPTYIVGGNAARALLDSVRAAAQVPGIDVSTSTSKVGIWGYSQGGQTAAAAGEIESSYAPELNVAGVAAGGVPADLTSTAKNLDGKNGAAFLLMSVYGLNNQYPDAIKLDTLANANGKAALATASSQCVFSSLLGFQNHSLSEYTVGNKTLDQFLAEPAIAAAVNAQTLGTKKIGVPLYLYHGTADEFIPLAPSVALKASYCNKGTNVTYASYPGEHITTQFQGAAGALGFLSDRFAGKITFGSCLTSSPAPVANPQDNTGNLKFQLDKWNLSGKVHLNTLNQDVILPSGSTFSAQTDINAQTLNGSLSVPNWKQNIVVLGLPIGATLSLTPSGSTTGTVSLDNSGQLHITGSTKAYIGVDILGTGSSCKTATPVTFPLNFDGPVSALGSGSLTFSGTTTFPSLTGCSGLTAGLVSSLFQGGNQKYSFTVAPPAPKGY